MFIYYVDLAWRSIKKTPILSLLMVLAISVGIGITITTLNVYSMMSFNRPGIAPSNSTQCSCGARDPIPGMSLTR